MSLAFQDFLALLGGLTVLIFVLGFICVAIELWYGSDLSTALTPKLADRAFEGKVVWVTGASSGVGKQVALLLARQNAHIIISSRSRDKLEAVKEECLRINENLTVYVLPLDLGKGETMQEKAAEALKHFGSIDVLINNGGCSTRVMAHNCNFALDQYVTNVDYVGHVALVKALLPHFRATGGATIMNTGSVASKIGVPVRTGYSGAKHALNGYMNALRLESMITGVDLYIGNVCLGSTKTNLPFHAIVDKVSNGSDDGTDGLRTFGQQDPNTASGMSPEFVAERILAVAHQRKLPEIWLGKSGEILALLLNQYLPNASIRIFSATLASYAVHKKE